MFLFINVFLLIFNVIPESVFGEKIEVTEKPKINETGQDRNGRLIGLLGLLAGLDIADSFEEEDEVGPDIRNQINKRTTSDWVSSLRVAYVHPNGKVEVLLNPNAYHDLLLHHYNYHYPQINRHGTDIQTIKVSSSSINPIQTNRPVVAETTVINDLPQIEVNKKEFKSGSKDKINRKRVQKLIETTTIDSDEVSTPISTETVINKRWKKETEVTTLPTTTTTFEDTTLDTTEATTTYKPEPDKNDSLTEGSALTEVLLPPSHTIANFKPTVPMKGYHYGSSSLNNIDWIYLTTTPPPLFKSFYKFRPSPRDLYLDKQEKFVPLYFNDVNSNHFELPSSDTGDRVLYEFEPLLN